MIKIFQGHWPSLAEDMYTAPGAFIIGKVTVGSKSSVWFNAVIRGDMDYIIIGDETNIQDNATLHTDEGFPVTVGDRVTVGHNAVLHGCTVEDDALVGMGAVILNGARIGKGAIVGAGSLVTAGTEIPPHTLAVGSPAKVIRELDGDENTLETAQYKNYLRITKAYREEKM